VEPAGGGNGAAKLTETVPGEAVHLSLGVRNTSNAISGRVGGNWASMPAQRQLCKLSVQRGAQRWGFGPMAIKRHLARRPPLIDVQAAYPAALRH
jgi:hypothetical protein